MSTTTTSNEAGDRFNWRKQPALNLDQLIALVMLRDPLAVERTGDDVGQDVPKQDETIGYSQRDHQLRHEMFCAEIARVGDGRRLEIGDAIAEITLHLAFRWNQPSPGAVCLAASLGCVDEAQDGLSKWHPLGRGADMGPGLGSAGPHARSRCSRPRKRRTRRILHHPGKRRGGRRAISAEPNRRRLVMGK